MTRRWTSSLPTDESSSNIIASKEKTKENKNWRIASELGRYVWPPITTVSSPTTNTTVVISGGGGGMDDNDNHRTTTIATTAAQSTRQRVIASIVLMLIGKGTTIATPFVFKMLVDSFSRQDHFVTTAAATVAGDSSVGQNAAFIDDTAILSSLLQTSDIVYGLPILPTFLLLSYGTSRALSSACNEARNAIFAHVSQAAIRNVGRSTFDHVHALDIDFHLNRNTGTLARIIERGNASIERILGMMVFNTIPTLLEVSIVTGCLYYQFGIYHASIVLGTVSSYVVYTVGITQWRTQFRKDMNRLNELRNLRSRKKEELVARWEEQSANVDNVDNTNNSYYDTNYENDGVVNEIVTNDEKRYSMDNAKQIQINELELYYKEQMIQRQLSDVDLGHVTY
jgi:ABC-type multidrug transport system fused ATPase/permease subunit